jgi:aerobic-type carbon monoxide dehydrogenase small subunit (CoxS/CutS family)
MATRSKARSKIARAPRAAGRATAGTPAQPDGTVTLRINGRDHALQPGRDITPSMTLAVLLKDRLGLTGLKMACGEGACGACTVLLDGKAVLSCMMLAVEAAGHEVETIEGVAPSDPVVQAFAEQCEPGYGTAIQCGYCTPGFVMAARGFLRENPRPTLDEVKEAMSGNICRCGCYAGIAQAVLHAAEKLAGHGGAR